MVVKLDGYTLYLDSLEEDFDVVHTEWDAWENEAYVRKMKVYGVIKRWTLYCHEFNVPWESSAAKNAQEKQAAGTTVTLEIDVQGGFSGSDKLHNIGSVDVKILSVDVRYDATDHRFRRFTVTVQAV